MNIFYFKIELRKGYCSAICLILHFGGFLNYRLEERGGRETLVESVE